VVGGGGCSLTVVLDLRVLPCPRVIVGAGCASLRALLGEFH
jgi:hypothetical protein